MKTLAIIPIALAGLLTTTLAADDWPAWRGLAGGAISRESGLPHRWSDTENVAWKSRLAGAGVASPIVSGDRVFVVSQAGTGRSRVGPRLGQGADATPAERALSRPATEGNVRFVVEALNLNDGRRLWTYDVPADGALTEVHDKHNLASASPVTDGERVYAVFGTGQVVAVDLSGKLVWSRNLGREIAPFDINWGNGSSPVVYRNTLVLACYHGTAPYLIALDSRTGAQVWKTDRPRGVISYSTPLVVPAAQGDEIIVNSSAGVEAFSAATGAALWHFDEPNQY